MKLKYTYNVCVDNIDIRLLKKQKERLVKLSNRLAAGKDRDALDGVVGLLDAITDRVDVGDFTYNTII